MSAVPLTPATPRVSLPNGLTARMASVGNDPHGVHDEPGGLEAGNHRRSSAVGGVTCGNRVRYDNDTGRPRHGVTPSTSPGWGRKPLAHSAAP